MILVGAFFSTACLLTFYAYGFKGAGRSSLEFIFMVFYGCTGAFIGVLHLRHLLCGRPGLAMASFYAIGIGLLVATVVAIATVATAY